MRISDWSSDVCSSDLDPFALEARFGRANDCDELLAQARQVLAEPIDAAILERMSGHSDRLLPLLLDIELGRAVDWKDLAAVEHEGHDDHGAMARTIAVILDTLRGEDDQDRRRIV